MSAPLLAGLAPKAWRVALFSLLVVAGCQTGQSTPPSVPETIDSIESLDGLPSDALRIAQEYRVSAFAFVGVPAEVLARIDVDESQVRSYEEFASDSEHRDAWARWLAECYTRAGWPSKVDPPGSGNISYEGPNAREILSNPDTQLCRVESLLLFPFRPEPQTREEWQYSYDHQLSLAVCLDAEGYDIPDPPTLDTYVDGKGMWTAYDFVPDSVGSDEWDRLIVVCPQ